MSSPLAHLLPFSGISDDLSKYSTASFVCRVYYVYVKQFFLLSFVLSASRQFFGDAILCNTDNARVPYEIVRDTCFINGTFTEDSGEIRHYAYYQWVSLYLLFLAFFFYAPYRLFSHCFARHVPVCHDETRYPDVVAAILHPSSYGRAFLKTVALELIYLFVVLPAAYLLTDRFLEGKLSKETADRLFPLETKCDVTYFSGGFETQARFHCMLPANVLHRLVFRAAADIFCVLLGLHVASLLFKTFVYFFPSLRSGGRPFRDDIDVWWIYRLVERNTQGENVWRLRKAFLDHHSRRSDYWRTPSKVTETPLDLLV